MASCSLSISMLRSGKITRAMSAETTQSPRKDSLTELIEALDEESATMLLSARNLAIMSNKKYDYRPNSNSKSSYYQEEFEDYGYDVKNVRRQSKKKVTKFKDQHDD